MLLFKLSVVRAIWIGMLIIAMTSILSITTIWLLEKSSHFKSSIESLKVDQYNQHKATLQHEVNRLLEYIDYSKSHTEERLRATVKSRTLEAYAIARHLHEHNQHHWSEQELRPAVVEALRPIRYNDGRGYYFMTKYSGSNLLFTDRPEIEGTNMLDSSDLNARQVVLDMIEITRNEGEGYYEYNWTKPGEAGNMHRKIAYVKYFAPLDAYIGTGEYFADVENDIKAEILSRLDGISFLNDGYIFAGTYQGISLSGPQKGRNMIDIEDMNGIKIVQELIRTAKAGGGYVEYVIPNFEGIESAPKLSYVVAVDDWEWYVGSGMYIGDIDNVVSQRGEVQRRGLISNLLTVLGLILVLMVITYTLVFVFKNHFSACFKSITGFFHQARTGSARLEPEQMRYSEFSQLAVEANLLVEERENIQKALIRSKESYQELVDTMSEGLIVVDSDENIKFFNHSAARLFGITESELAGRNLRGFMDAADFAEIQRKTRDSRRGLSHSYEITIAQPGGDQRRILISVCPQFDENNEFTGSLGTFHDITQRHFLEQRARQTQKMEAIGTLAGGIAHDFNNILFAILGFAHMIQETLDEEAVEAEFAEEIIVAGNRAAGLVRQILSFAKQTEVEPGPVNLSPVIQEVCKLIGATVPTNIEIKQSLEATNAVVIGDIGQIHQVLMNLCTNACQAMKSGAGRLTIATQQVEVSAAEANPLPSIKPGDYIEIKVTDTGHGMTKSVLDRIFDPFYSTKATGEGSGLGLSVAHGIITGIGGSISVTSSPGHGSEFMLLLPVSDQPSEEAGDQATEVDYRGHECLLVVDDEHNIARLLSRLLESQGYQVDCFTESAKALEAYLANQDKYDLVITDQDMPGLTGGQLSERILEVRPDARIILCTGFSDILGPEAARRTGITDYLSKPVGMQVLLKAVREALDQDGEQPAPGDADENK